MKRFFAAALFIFTILSCQASGDGAEELATTADDCNQYLHEKQCPGRLSK